HVEAAVRLHGSVDEFPDIFFDSHVGSDVGRLSPSTANLLFDLGAPIGTPTAEGDLAAFLREHPGGSRANPGCRSGDQHNLVVKAATAFDTGLWLALQGLSCGCADETTQRQAAHSDGQQAASVRVSSVGHGSTFANMFFEHL
ncbi:MAG TPA: hypothetical protein VK801_02500, partial [Caulobacteraceae bacterium]|nr:hypothetical protein [Caulobacteraceae bacterium]